MKKSHLRYSAAALLLLMGGYGAYALPSAGEASQAVAAQKLQSVNGVIKDTAGNPLVGVSVKVEGSNVGVVTDIDGRFSLKAAAGQKLEVSYVGFKTQTVTVPANGADLTIELRENNELLNEMVVVGYGIQKKANLTGSVASVKIDEVTDIPVSNTASLLQGRMSGVTVSSYSSQPGADDVEIRIRGINTFGNSAPLVLIDGVEGSINTIAPNDIESISVLKDAASAAIYGVRAANGVILVTTKQGSGERKSLSYNGSFGIQNATVLPDYIDSWDWATLYNEQNAANGDESTNYTPEMIEMMRNGSRPDLFANTDWQSHLFRTAPIQTHHLSMSGGSETSSYMASIGYVGQDGLMKGTSSDRVNIRLNAESKFIDLITFGMNVSGNHEEVKEPNIGTWYLFEQMKWHSRPSVPYQYSNGNWGYVDGNDKLQPIKNPGFAASVQSKTKHDRFDGKAYLEVEPLKNLKIRTSFAYQYNHYGYLSIDPVNITTDSYGKPVGGSGKNYIGESNHTAVQWINENIISYNFDINKLHSFGVLLGQSNQFNNFRTTNANGEDLPSEQIKVINGALSTSSSGSAAEATLRSWFGRVNYNFDNRYLFEFNLRRDESSRIPKKNRVGYFPSASIGWNMAQEKFMQDIQFLNQLKIRASWGKLGNQDIGYYPFSQYISPGSNYVWGDSKMLGVAITSLANPDIKWETTATTDIGIDAAFFNSRLMLTADYFYKKTNDILLQLPIPGIVGVDTEPYVNAAEVKNVGWEIALNYNDRFGDVRFGANFNLSHIKNEIMDLHGKESWINGWSINLEGHPINAYYGYLADDLIRTEEELEWANANNVIGGGALRLGDVNYKDISGPDGVPDGIVDTNDRTVIGNPFPDITYAFGFNAEYKGFDFTTFFQGIAGVDRVIMDYPSISGNVTTVFLDRYNETLNPNGKFPRLGFSDYNAQPSSYWLKDASYLRCKNIELGYSFKNEWISKARLERLRLYISAQNLFTITGIKDYDPEMYGSETRCHAYPNACVYTVGLNITL